MEGAENRKRLIKQNKLIKAWYKANRPKKKKRSHQKKKKPGPKLTAPDNLRKLPYSAFLQSDYWKHVRKAILARDEYKCRVCGEARNLHVHHETYTHHFKELMHLEDLITLCKDCHNKWHKEIQVDYEVERKSVRNHRRIQ